LECVFRTLDRSLINLERCCSVWRKVHVGNIQYAKILFNLEEFWKLEMSISFNVQFHDIHWYVQLNDINI
jgi:hypothetical protein